MTKFFARNATTGAITEIEASAPFDAAPHLAAGRYAIAVASAYAAEDLVIPVAPEAGATGHWLLGADNPGHDGLTGGALSPVGADTTADASHVTLPAALLSGLRSTLAETPDFTVCCVVRATQGCMLMNNYGTAPGLQLVHVSGGFLFANSAESGTTVVDTDRSGEGLWTFVAASIDAAGSMQTYVRGAGAATIRTKSGPRGGLGSNPIGLGPVFHGGNTGYANAVDMAEFITFDAALTSAQFDAIYDRSAARMADRGITLG